MSNPKINLVGSYQAIPELPHTSQTPNRPKLKYDLTVQQIVNHSLGVLPFGIDPYFPPKMERAYLLKPQLGKQDKDKKKTFTELEAKLHKFVPGPIYNTMPDWSKDFPHNKGQFLRASRVVPEAVATKKEKVTPSPGEYHNLEAWKQ